ncbi:MAG TPA: serine protease [Solirubrobacterales bacterium]|nr:serine protease [Solirubrobacterales bacterium]
MAALCAFLATAAVAAAAPGGDAGARASIIGGSPASIADFPSLAFIEAKETPKKVFSCTGSVIAPRVVLTAGHCVEDIETGRLTPIRDYRVATGVADLKQAGEANVFPVVRAVTYHGFDPGATRGDAGLLILGRPTTAPPIQLATAADAELQQPGTRVKVAGWGVEHAGDSAAPATLRATSTTIQRPGYCHRAANAYYPFYSAALQLCTTDRPTLASGTCFGDSGGPAIAHRPDGTAVEVGIVSTGGPECRTELPNVFTRVDRISTWAAEWVAAIESGAAAPPVRVPPIAPPTMTIAKAETLVVQTLLNDFGERFARGFGIRGRCERVEPLKVKCALAWFFGRDDYFGTVTVYYATRRSSVVWNGRYTISWVNDHCWFSGGNRASCPVHTRRR